ncbi:MAG TPA: ABC transporter permease, partial [Actinomycetota bacterium]|nr:ABC transporter permease [Actinomycetota bacterium]
MAVMLALAAGGFAVSAALRLRSEESAVRADPVLAGPIGRVRWAAGYVLVAVGGSAVILVVAGLLTGLGTAVSLNDISEVLPVTGAFLAQLPAVFVLIGVTVALMGWVPRWSAIAWAALAFVVIVGLLGDLLQIPHWVRSISPFDHIPLLPAEPMQWLPIVVLTAIGAFLAGIGLVGIRRRDIG